MIDVKRATQLAAEYLKNLLGDEAVSDVRLEEVELARRGDWTDETPVETRSEDDDVWDKSYWLITVSFLPQPANPLFAQSRQYKIFKLEAETGDFVAMKMRDVA